MVGQTISHYRIVGQLGAGGMGVVYRAEDLRLGRAVALKFVSRELGHEADAVQRLRAEARAASALNHGNICTIYDIDEHEGHPFIVMELMKGRTLREVLAGGPLKVHQLVDAGIEIADALHAAHAEGIIHRDIKPANIFLTDRGHVKVLDFGLAKLMALVESTGTTRDRAERTAAGVTLGTIAYMSPEQATGEDLDGRTDLFSLGVVLYECATGHHPFPGKTTATILASILNRAPVAPVALNPDLPLRLQDVINNCLEKDRELRYQSAADVRADLKRVRRDIESGQSRAVVLAGSGAAARDSGGSRRTAGAEPRPARAWPAAAAAVAVVVVAGGSYVLWRREPPPVEREAPQQASAPQQAPAPAADPAISSLLALAAASYDARNYRAALAYADQALARDPAHEGAAKIRDDARGMLARFDAAVARARQRLAAGDLRGATQALEDARGIDASSPAVSEIALRLAERARPSAADDAARRSRPPVEAPRPPREPDPEPVETAGDRPPQSGARVQNPPAIPVAPPASAGTPLPAPSAAPPPAARPPAAAAAEPKTEPKAETKPAEPREAPSRPASPTPAEDEAAIRRAIATYARAIERKDLALFRSIKPNLTAAEERRLEEGFRAVSSQRVDLTILSVDRRADEASVLLRRRDTIEAGGRRHTSESQQTVTLARRGSDWIIVDIR